MKDSQYRLSPRLPTRRTIFGLRGPYNGDLLEMVDLKREAMIAERYDNNGQKRTDAWGYHEIEGYLMDAARAIANPNASRGKRFYVEQSYYRPSCVFAWDTDSPGHDLIGVIHGADLVSSPIVVHPEKLGIVGRRIVRAEGWKVRQAKRWAGALPDGLAAKLPDHLKEAHDKRYVWVGGFALGPMLADDTAKEILSRMMTTYVEGRRLTMPVITHTFEHTNPREIEALEDLSFEAVDRTIVRPYDGSRRDYRMGRQVTSTRYATTVGRILDNPG